MQKGYLTYPQLIHRMSSAPCKLYGLEGGKMAVGMSADLVLFHPEETWTVSSFLSKSSNSPFMGKNFREWSIILYAGEDRVSEGREQLKTTRKERTVK